VVCFFCKRDITIILGHTFIVSAIYFAKGPKFCWALFQKRLYLVGFFCKRALTIVLGYMFMMFVLQFL